MSLMDSYCVKCLLQFDKKIIFNMHMSIVHKEMIEIKEEPTNIEKESEETTMANLLSCEICNKTFSTKGNLKKHVSSVHERKKPFECEICNKVFFEKGTLKIHISSVHEKKKSFECDICEKTFAVKDKLKRHVSFVHEK